MGRDHDETASLCPLQIRVGIVFSHSGLQRINGRITGYIDGIRVLAFPQKIFFGQLCRCKIIGRNNAHCLTVEFLRIGRIDVVGTKTSLHMSHRDLQIEACQCRHKCRGSISMDQYHIRLHLFQHCFDPV